MSVFGDIWNNTAGGMLWNPLKKATGLTDAQMIGLGAMAAAPFALPALGAAGGASAAGTAGATGGIGASAIPAGMEGMSAAQLTGLGMTTPEAMAGAGGSSGLLGSFSQYAKPAMTALQGASMAKGLLSPQQQQAQPAPLPQYQDMSGSLYGNQSQLDQLRQQRMARRGLLGGGNGLA